jgi:hypothetical protein
MLSVRTSARAGADRLPGVPIIDISAARATNGDGYTIQNRMSSSAPSKNIWAYTSGAIRLGTEASGNATLTRQYATGPRGIANSAARIQLTPTTSLARYIMMQNASLPAGTYTMGFKVKSNIGAGAQSFQFGEVAKYGSNAALPAINVDESGWVQVSQTWTLASTQLSGTTFYVAANLAAVDILVDEFQFYRGSSLPDYATDLGAGHLEPLQKLGTPLVITGGLIDTTTARPMIAKLPGYPANTVLSEATFLTAIEATAQSGTDLEQLKLIATDSANGVFDVYYSNGRILGTPMLTKNNQSGKPYDTLVAGKGPVVAAVRFKDGEQSLFINGIPRATTTSAFSPISRSSLGIFGDPSLSGNPAPGTSPYLGKTSSCLVYDKWLSDSDIAKASKHLAKRHFRYSKNSVQRWNYWVADGDSITIGLIVGATDTYFAQFFEGLPAKRFLGHNVALSSSQLVGGTVQSAMQRLPGIVRELQAAVAMGHNAIASLLIGANAIPAQSDWITYADAIRATGAKFIACTVTPNRKKDLTDGDLTFEPARQAWNTWLRGTDAATHYDALADFAADPNLGDYNAPIATPLVYYADTRHWSNTGYTVGLGIIQPLINALAV